MTATIKKEKRCIWCGGRKFGEDRCVCDDPRFELMEQCSVCRSWEPVDHITWDEADPDQAAMCVGCAP